MIILNNPQGSDEWLHDRLGRASASQFDKIMTTVYKKPSKDQYLYRVAAERISGELNDDTYQSYAMERGCDLEERAIANYRFEKDLKVERVGFCLPFENADYGCSPDGLVGDDGGIEIKCPSLEIHLEYCAKGAVPNGYLAQVYGSLFVTGRAWWDWMSYHPNARSIIIRTNATDQKYIDWKTAFSPILDNFLKKIKELQTNNQISEEEN